MLVYKTEGGGERSLPRGKGSFWSSKCDRGIHLVLSVGDEGSGCGSHGSLWIFIFLVPSVISIVAVTDHFLLSLLFPVSCSCLNPWSLPFLPPVLLSVLPQWRGGEAMGEQSMVSSVSVGELNWGIPFLNQGCTFFGNLLNFSEENSVAIRNNRSYSWCLLQYELVQSNFYVWASFDK